MKKIALFPGSFDPFTIGHYSLVKRALSIFDEIIIAIGINTTKDNYSDIDDRKQNIEKIFEEENEKIKVIVYKDLTADIVEKEKATCILRGIRNTTDYEYEKNIADMHRELFNIETVFLFADLKYAHISSSMIRELEKYGKNTSELRP